VTPNSIALLLVSIFVLACCQPPGPPLTISNVVVLEPVPGTSIAVGYLLLKNHSNQPITIEKITSPQLARIEMHETVILNGIARMLPLASVIVDRQSEVVFERGGKHLMMFPSSLDIAPGMPVSIEFHNDDHGLLIVATTVSSRDEVPERLPQ